MVLLRALGRSLSPAISVPRCVGSQWAHSRTVPLASSTLTHQFNHDPRIVQAHFISTRPRDGYTYPENLNVFDAGWASSMSIGFTRIAAAAFAGYGFYSGATATISGSIALYMLPIYAVLPAVPLVITGLAFGGYVSHINVWLPQQARRSKEDLIRFASNIPPDTTIQLKSLWFRPWPHTQEVQFKEIRRLPSSWARLTNVELQPALWTEATRRAANRSPFYNWLVRTLMGRLFVRTRQLKDRSRVSGVWDRIWEQIPVSGARARSRTMGSREPSRITPRVVHVGARNR